MLDTTGILKVYLYYTRSFLYILKKRLSREKLNPNPDIEKIDIGDHKDLERFFLN